MFNLLFSAIKAEFGIGHMTDIVTTIAELVELLGEDYMKDGNARDAAIDAIIQILQAHKTKQP